MSRFAYIGTVLCCLLLVAAVCSLEEAQEYLTQGSQYTFEEREPIDFSLVIDKSGSMRVGNRFVEAQTAAKGFVRQLSQGDRASIVAFDSRAHHYASFTSDQEVLVEAVNSMRIGDWTQYQAGLYRSLEEYQSRELAHQGVMVFMSDGRPDDDPEMLSQAVSNVLAANICIYTIAYAEEADEEAQRVLESIAQESQEVTGCGGYFRAEEDTYDLRRIYSQIYDETASEQAFDVSVDVHTNADVSLVVSARSEFNNAPVVGEACFAPEISIAILREGRAVFEQQSTSPYAQVTLERGVYDYFVSVRETCGGECSFTGSAQGSFEVTEGVVACSASFSDVSSVINPDPQEVLAGKGVDVVVVMDRSGSMAGEPMRLAREATTQLLSQLRPRDRASVMTFSTRPHVLMPLTSDFQSLARRVQGVEAGGSTNYALALEKLPEVLAGGRNEQQTVIFLSDGIPTDVGGSSQVFSVLQEVLGDACLYTIGYGQEGVLAAEVLSDMAAYSQAVNACGLFYYVPAQEEMLSTTVGEVFSLSKQADLELFDVQAQRTSGRSFEVSARVRSAHDPDVIVPQRGAACIAPAEVVAMFGERRFPLRYSEGRYSGTVVVGEDVVEGVLVARIVDEEAPARSLTGAYTLVLDSRSTWWMWLGGVVAVIFAAKVFMRLRRS